MKIVPLQGILRELPPRRLSGPLRGGDPLCVSLPIRRILPGPVFLFSIRSRLPFFKAGRPSWYVTGLAGSATILLPCTSFGQAVFRFTPPTAIHPGIITGLAGALFVCTRVVKNFFYRTAH